MCTSKKNPGKGFKRHNGKYYKYHTLIKLHNVLYDCHKCNRAAKDTRIKTLKWGTFQRQQGGSRRYVQTHPYIEDGLTFHIYEELRSFRISEASEVLSC